MTGLKQPVVLVLLERISSISYTNENEMERVGIACRILGTNAYPVLLEVMKGFASEDPDRRSSSSVVMQIAGPVSFGPAIEFLKANAEGTGQEMIRSDILYLIQIFPEASIAELLRLYRVANKPSEVKEYLALGFQEAVGQQDCELLIPFLKPLLRDNDPFIVLSTLEYVKRCGPTASGAREELFRLLQSSNPEIRVEATNAVQLISRND